MSDAYKVSFTVNKIEYSAHIDNTLDVNPTLTPCDSCGAKPGNPPNEDFWVQEWYIESMENEFGDSVNHADPVFHEAERRLGVELKSGLPVCPDCFSKMRIEISSD